MVSVPAKIEPEQAEHLSVLASKLGVTESELIRQFVTAGLVLNPVSDSDRAAHAAKQRARGAGEVLGLVVPLDPLRSRRDPDPPPKGRGRRPLARVLPLAARIPGGRHTESEGLSLGVGASNFGPPQGQGEGAGAVAAALTLARLSRFASAPDVGDDGAVANSFFLAGGGQ